MAGGNGEGRTGGELEIVVEQIQPDWVVIRPALSTFRKAVELERLPVLLHMSLVAWIKDHPWHRVRSSLGIVEDGFTVAIHLWVDGHP